jgi:hypothetical protein
LDAVENYGLMDTAKEQAAPATRTRAADLHNYK